MSCVVSKPRFFGMVGGKEILEFPPTRFAKRFLRDRFNEKRFA